MIKKFVTTLVIVSLIFSSTTIQANVITSAMKGGAIGLVITQAVRIGGPVALRAAGKKIADYVAKHPAEATVIVSSIVILAIENQKWRQNAIQLIGHANLSPWLDVIGISKTKIDEQGQIFDKAYAFVVSDIAYQVDYENACTVPDLPRALSYDQDYREFLTTDHPIPKRGNIKFVSFGDVGSYYALQQSEVTGDEMEHDHIPSKAAVKEFFNQNFKIKDEKILRNYVEAGATAVEIPYALHEAGRTYRKKNTKIIIELDARNLLKATLKDMAWHVVNSDYDSKLIIPFQKVLLRNAALCLYQGDKL